MSEERAIEEQETPEPAPESVSDDQPAGEPQEAPAEEQAVPEVIDEPPQMESAAELKERLEKMERRQMYLQRQLEQRQSNRPPEPAPPTRPAETNAPRQDDFESYEDYIDARTSYLAEQKVQEYLRTQEQRQNESQRQEFVNDTWARGRQMFGDFDAVVGQDTLPISETMVEFAEASESPAELFYYLGRNPEACTAISRMSPVQAAKSLTRIESEIGSQNATAKPPPRQKTTSAPPPIKPSGSVSNVSQDPTKMSQREYEAWRRGGGGQ